MKRRSFLKTTCAGAAGFPFLSCSPDRPRPSIVLIMADDLGYECLGCNGSLDYKTPVLDDLAANGMRFTHCYSQPLCTPSRVQIMTGRYNHRNYIGFGKIDPKEVTFGHVLKDAGYATCIVGKWQLGGDLKSPQNFGFDDYCLWHITGRRQRYWKPRIFQNGRRLQNVSGRYGPDIFCEFILDFMRKNRERPFFVYYPMALTHDPFCATPDSDGPRNETQHVKYFKDMVAYMDKIVGKIVDRLDDLKLRDNTLILFTGDNGTHKKIISRTQNGTVRGGKAAMTDSGTHVPLIANWPGRIPAGRVNENLVDFSDFLPTFATFSGGGLPADRPIDGLSFASQLLGKADKTRQWVFCHYWGYGRRKEDTREFVRDKRFKLYDNGEFFDVENDPLEQHPLDITHLGTAQKTACHKLENALDYL